jgi:hypothetical protein
MKEKQSKVECPKEFCFFWNNGCRCSFGLCKRLDEINGDHDWYEPNEPALEKARLPWHHFVVNEEDLKGVE